MTTDLAPRRVLIVDDEPAIRSILERLFKNAGYVVECAATGTEGLRRFYQLPQDVIIVDRGMPEMNGEDMALQIKSTHPHVPMILITGLPHLISRHDLFLAVVAKPFRPTDLLGLAAKALATGVRCADPSVRKVAEDGCCA